MIPATHPDVLPSNDGFWKPRKTMTFERTVRSDKPPVRHENARTRPCNRGPESVRTPYVRMEAHRVLWVGK